MMSSTIEVCSPSMPLLSFLLLLQLHGIPVQQAFVLGEDVSSGGEVLLTAEAWQQLATVVRCQFNGVDFVLCLSTLWKSNCIESHLCVA